VGGVEEGGAGGGGGVARVSVHVKRVGEAVKGFREVRFQMEEEGKGKEESGGRVGGT
jgi:hypothetical protein